MAGPTSDTPVTEPVDTEEPLDIRDIFEPDILRLVTDFDYQDKAKRDLVVRVAKRNELFIAGVSNIYFNEFAHDYRLVNPYAGQDEEDDYEDDIDLTLDESILNVLLPYKESIIAALSAALPVTRFFPDDADNDDDIFTADTWTAVADIIRRKNKAKLLFIKALSTFWTEGFVAAYCKSAQGKKFGVDRTPHMTDITMHDTTHFCPECGTTLGEDTAEAPPSPNQQMPNARCPRCGIDVPPMSETQPRTEQVQDGYDEVLRTQEDMKIYGSRYVQVAPWAKDASQTPYLFLNEEFHVAQLQSEYPDFADKIEGSMDAGLYDRWARTLDIYGHSAEAYGHLATKRTVWLRPWAYYQLNDAEKIAQLQAAFPSGLKATIINDMLVDIEEEELCDHWTIAIDPMADGVFSTPPVNKVIAVQDMTTEQRLLTLDTMRHAISVTFVESRILDLERYKRTEIRPGHLVPVKSNLQGNIGNSFFSTRGATLSQEVSQFGKQLTQDGQFESGAFPSIYGGIQEGSSGTASEYSQSRAMALQRLQLLYYIATFFWAEFEGKAVKDYLNNLKDDTKFSLPQGKSGFISVWVFKSQLNGVVGDILPESTEQFPASWAQKRDVVYQLIQLQNDFINEALFHPENRHLVAEVLGLPEFYIPGDEDRTLQLAEIVRLVASKPMPGPNGQPQSSVPIEPLVDDNQVHAEICKAWMVSPVGQYMRQTNPDGYQNVAMHCIAHQMAEMQKQMMMAGPPQQALPPGKEGDQSKPADVPAPAQQGQQE